MLARRLTWVKRPPRMRQHSVAMRPLLVPFALAASLVAGCGLLLPRASTDTPSPFADFEAARAAAERIEPFRTRTEQLKGLGFDPTGGKNVTLIPYPDIVARLAPYSGVPLSELDPGIRECILAKSACRGWLFHFERQDRRREGGFWGDFFNVHRTTTVTGWTFDALVVDSAGVVLFRNWGGQAHADRVEKQTNPLGPFQPAGESAGSAILR